LDYLGFSWPVIPFFGYRLTAAEGWDRLYESFELGARARVSPNVRLDGYVGYFRSHGMRTDYSRPTGRLGVIHEIGPQTTHSLYGGSSYFHDEYGEDLFAHYVRYTLAHRFGLRLRGSLFVQVADTDNLDGIELDRSGWSAGAYLTAALSDYTLARLSVNYDESDVGASPFLDSRRWAYRATIQQRLLPYLYGSLGYQYVDVDTSGTVNYDEHLYRLTLDYLF
jgi:hypothetical protein